VMTPVRVSLESELPMRMLFSLLGLLRCLDRCTVMVPEERCQPAMMGWLSIINGIAINRYYRGESSRCQPL
jgi:hypothetical protein